MSRVDYKDIVEKYLKVEDWRVKENSTVTYSVGGLILSNSGNVTANYWLNDIYDDEISNAHSRGDIHIHDLSMLTGYCFTGDTRVKLLDGTSPTFKELVKDYRDKEIWVYAYDLETNSIKPARAINPRITRKAKEQAYVTLDNGEVIKSTTDHLFLTREGNYVQAKDLKQGTSLMSVYVRRRGNYEEIGRQRDEKGRFVNHKVVSVDIVELDEQEEMYDITVPKYENFALESGVFVHNCAGWSLKQLIQEGLGGVAGKITSAPAKHLNTLCNQMVNFLGIMQNEWAGAQAFSSFDTYLSAFVKADNMDYYETKKAIESFVYGVNIPSRWGTQSPFTNITLDWTVPNDLKDLQAIVGGKEMDFTYGDCQKEMDMINKAFLEIMVEGDAEGRGFQYPINLVA